MEKKPSMLAMIVAFPANFWYANLMEMFERLAFFGVRAIAPLYMVAAADRSGLGLTYTDKGDIYFWWALVQCLVPMVSGGYTERYGYRKSIAVAFTLNIIGYLLMARALPVTAWLAGQGWSGAGYWVFLAAALFVALGTAIFKPPVHGTIARSTDAKTSSMGFGIFYWVVNIGGALAPMAAAKLRGEINWEYVFYAAAIVTACNFLPLVLLYREPTRTPAAAGAETTAKAGAEGKQPGPVSVFISSILTIFKDMRLVAFLLIFSCFWLMFMQLWDLLPNFIEEWVDTSDTAAFFGWFSRDWVLANGQTKPEMLININPVSVILLVLFISWLVGRINKVAAMVIGMVISLVGFTGAGLTSVGVICALMIFVFSIGEMACSPTFSAYVALIAPPDKKALYMGYSNLPFAIGWAAGNKIGGWLYENLANKYALARAYLTEHLHLSADAVKELNNEQVFERLAASLNGGAGGTVQEATRLLWNLHHPYMVWIYLGLFGVLGTVGMIAFYLATAKKPTAAATSPAAG